MCAYLVNIHCRRHQCTQGKRLFIRSYPEQSVGGGFSSKIIMAGQYRRVASFPSKHKKGQLKFSWDFLESVVQECFPRAEIERRATDFSWWRGHESSLRITISRVGRHVDGGEDPLLGNEPASSGVEGIERQEPEDHDILLLLLNKDPPEMLHGEKPQGKSEADSIGARRLEYGPESGVRRNGEAESVCQPDRRKFQDAGKNDFMLFSNSVENPMIDMFLEKISGLDGYSAEYITRHVE